MGPALGEMAGGYFMLSSYTLDDVSFRQLGRASMERAMADRERIRQYNRRYGGWWYGDWDESGDMRRSVGTLTVSGVLQPLAVLAGADVSKAAEAIAAPAASSTPMPAQPIFGGKERRESRIAMPSLLLQSYSEATGAVPGTLAALAADRFIPLRAKLAEMKPSERRDAAIAAIDAALKKLPEAAAACESTGAFWSYQGWQTMPAIWDFQQPACQAWPGSMSMRDVTQWSPGLQSTWSDVGAPVLDAFGRKPAGKVDDRAAEAIAAARRNTPLMRIKHVDANDNVLAELWAAGGDRFAWTGRGDMYLREDFICDGKAIYQVYPELGLAARRGQLAWRLPALRGLVPHVMPPADQLARACDVAFVEQRDGRTTVKLTAVSEPEETAPRGKPTSRPSGESAIRNPQSAISLLVTFDGWGFIHNEEWRVGGKPRLMRTFAYDGAKVVSTWTGRTEKGEDKRLGEGRYLCEVREPAGVVTQFNAPGAETVVIDMPLRRCEHYEALLKEAGSGDANRPERIRLGRQLAMAALQEHGWQQPWGSVRKTYETLLNVHKELKAADRPVLVGDVTLMGCSGYSPGTISGAQPRMPSEPALQTYMQNHGNANRMAELAKEQNGTFIGHLAAYAMTYQGGDRLAAVKKFLADYPDSPLHYAAAMYAGNDEKTWLELAKLPRWRLVALYTAAQRQPSAAVAEAFEAYHKEMLEHGWSVPISRQVAAALKTDKARWRRVLDRCHKAAADANDAGALLRLAELAWVCRLDGDDQQLADRCLTEAEKLAGTRLPLAWKLAVTQSLWAMGRTKEAWDKQQEVLAALAEHKLAASPALLALSARLAQAAGQHARAVELEMAAIEAEKPHMPQRINVHLFRQRYQWLWNELTQRVRQCAEAVKKTPADAAAGRLLTEALDRAKGVWDTWMRVDSANANSLYQQLAALYRDAGRTDDAWRVVSSIIDEKPKDGQSYYFVGTYFRGGNDSDAALGFYARACEVEPTNGDWAWGRADFLKQLGRKKEARAAFEEIARTKWQPRFEHYVNRAKEAMKGLQATAPGGAITPR